MMGAVADAQTGSRIASSLFALWLPVGSGTPWLCFSCGATTVTPTRLQRLTLNPSLFALGGENDLLTHLLALATGQRFFYTWIMAHGADVTPMLRSKRHSGCLPSGRGNIYEWCKNKTIALQQIFCR